MSATKILWGQIIVVFTVVLIDHVAATQWVAWEVGLSTPTRAAWFESWLACHLPPPAFFWWWYAYDAYAPRVFVEGAYIAASGGFISIAAAIGMSVWRAREAKIAATYARLAGRQDQKFVPLVSPHLMGWFSASTSANTCVTMDPEHVLCFAPTRSGKGVGLVVPTLLTWPGSCIVHDIRVRTDSDIGLPRPTRLRAAV